MEAKMGMTTTMTAFLLFLAILVATSHSSDSDVPNQIHILMPRSSAAGDLHIAGINCLSWRLAVEADNIINWHTVPSACADYVGHYMLGMQYRQDINMVVAAAITYAESLNISGDGKDIWVFDIDETTLSNLPYYALPDVAFGAKKYNSTKFGEWVETGLAPAVPGVLKLYRKLINLGIRIVFLTGSSDVHTKVRVQNLRRVGYTTWLKLILKPAGSGSTTSLVYKSTERGKLEAEGYRIVGNMGDQWTDILGPHAGARTFKLPDPMYYIS